LISTAHHIKPSYFTVLNLIIFAGIVGLVEFFNGSAGFFQSNSAIRIAIEEGAGFTESVLGFIAVINEPNGEGRNNYFTPSKHILMFIKFPIFSGFNGNLALLFASEAFPSEMAGCNIIMFIGVVFGIGVEGF